MQNAVLEESQAGIKMAGEISTPLDMQVIPLWWLKEGLNSQWKSWLKTQISEN